MSSVRSFHSRVYVVLFGAVFGMARLCAWAQDTTQERIAAPAPPPLIVDAIDESRLTTLKGNTHPLARPEFDLGTAPASLPMQRMLLVLKRSPEQESALRKLLDDQQDKNSPNYHKWLSPEQFGKQFGPTDNDIQVITSWLQSHGFEVGATKGRTILEFSGSASQVREAFHTTIHKYLVNGEQHWANASDPQIPAALTPAVAGVASLNDFRPKAMNSPAGAFSRDPATGKITAVHPEFTFPSGCVENNKVQGACYYALGPYDFATIYDVLPLWNSGINGSGETIAIVGESSINVQDVANFRSMFGLPANNPTVILNGPDPGIQGDESEADIDVQWSGAVAPNATIDFVVSQSTETTAGVDLSAVYIVENNLAPVMSESYGYCELGLGTSGNQFYSSLWQQAAAEGITVFVSSGDNGAAGCDDFNGQPPSPAQYGLQVSGFASTPYNVAVGGTDFNDFNNPATYWSTTNNSTTQASALSYIPETTWNDSCTNAIFGTVGFSTSAETNCNDSRLVNFVVPEGGSGGVSNCTTPSGLTPANCAGGYAKPSWQSGAGVPADRKRDLPDVSLFASNGFLGSFYIICQSDQTGSCSINNFLGFGGTSVSSPAFAGIMALVNQQTGSRQGNANYVLYKLAAQQPTVFHDVTSGTIAMPCATNSKNCTTTTAGHAFGVLSGYNAGTGYDLATGLGSVDANLLVTKWSSVTMLPSDTTLSSLTPTTITHGQTVNFSASVAAKSGTGTTPTGAIALLAGSSGPEIGDFLLSNGDTSGSTALLPGGSYSVVAHYAGDGTYGPSDSGGVSVNVTAEASAVFPNLVTISNTGAITSFSANSATYGSGYYLFRVDVGNSTASVSPSTGISSTCAKGTSSCPTGSVSMKASGTSLDGTTLPLNSAGYAENQSIPPGSYTVSATYSGDASYSGSTGSVAFAVAKAPTTASAGVAGTPVQYGNFEQINADIATTSNGAPPTGTFQFLVDGSAIGSPVGVYESGPGNSSSTTLPYAWADASTSTEFLGVGTHTLAVQYSGDTYYAASASVPSNVTVTKAQPSFLTYGWGSPSASIGQTVAPTGTMYGSNSGISPTGTMTFYDNGNPISSAVSYTPHNSPGILDATTSYTFTTAGNHSLTIQYAGDANYLPATNGLPNVIFVSGPVGVAPSGAVVIAAPGQSGSTTLTLMPNQGFTGNVALSCSPDPKALESTCSFTSGTSSGSTLQLDLDASGATVTFNVTTTAPHSTAHAQAALLLAIGGLGTVAVLLLPRSRRARIAKPKILLAVTMTVGMTLSGCGGGGNSGGGGGTAGGGGGVTTDPGTPTGQYSFTVTTVTGSGTSALSVGNPVTVWIQ